MANQTNMQQLPGEVIGHIALQTDKGDFHNFRLTSQSIFGFTCHEFAERYCRHLDVCVLRTGTYTLAKTNRQLQRTVNPVSGATSAHMVSSINFHNRFGYMGGENARINAIGTLLTLIRNADTIAIRTHATPASRILFQALAQTPTTSLAIRHLTISAEGPNNPRRVRATRQQILSLLTKHRNTLQTLNLDTAMLSAADWAPILVYIRDQMALRDFTFFHCPHQMVPRSPLFALMFFPVNQTVQQNFVPGEGYWFRLSIAEMHGVQTVKRGANRLLSPLMLGSTSYNAALPI